MKEKGFTLIELLAVIVILAIIALIATPIILNIINDSKVESKKRSAENYLDAVELAVANKNTKGKFNPDTCEMTGNIGECTGEFDVVHCNNDNEETACTTANLEVKVDGELPTEATIVFNNGTVADETVITIGGTPLEIKNGKFEETKEEINHLAKQNVRPVTTPTTGIVPIVENANLKPGSEFQIQVSDDSGWLTFFVLSNDGDYVNLIAEQNITPDGKFTREPQDGDEWYESETGSYDNRYGPQTAYTYLSKATNNWTNIPIIESFYYEDEGHKEDSTNGYQSIKTEYDKILKKYITTITPYSSSYGPPVTYENMRTRLPYLSEIELNTSCKIVSSSTNGSCPLWMVNYLYSSSHYTSDKKINSIEGNKGYTILSTIPGYNCYSIRMHYDGYIENYPYYIILGIRPVITVLKSDLLRVM